jgi:hypothetical protein
MSYVWQRSLIQMNERDDERHDPEPSPQRPLPPPPPQAPPPPDDEPGIEEGGVYPGSPIEPYPGDDPSA